MIIQKSQFNRGLKYLIEFDSRRRLMDLFDSGIEEIDILVHEDYAVIEVFHERPEIYGERGKDAVDAIKKLHRRLILDPAEERKADEQGDETAVQTTDGRSDGGREQGTDQGSGML